MKEGQGRASASLFLLPADSLQVVKTGASQTHTRVGGAGVTPPIHAGQGCPIKPPTSFQADDVASAKYCF